MDVFPQTSESVIASLIPAWGERRFAVDGQPVLTGLGALSGVVTVSGVEASRAVRVYDDATMTFAGSTVSESDGTWSVPGLTKTRPLRAIVLGGPGERDVTISGLYAE